MKKQTLQRRLSLREHAGAEESPALEAELHSETVIAEEKEETTVSSNHEYALRQEAQNEEAGSIRSG